ncbi:MAG: serine protease [Pleurocapsa sp. SU_196_0]|nr:serine protease [Pleurocapsa sp. SU_196_0]
MSKQPVWIRRRWYFDRVCRWIIVITFVVFFTSCLNHGTLDIQPRDARIALGESRLFRALIAGREATVRWTASAGSISSEGVFTTPNQPGVVTITAESESGFGSREQVNVTVTPSVSSVTISPLEPALLVGERLPFSSVVTGRGNPAQGVKWSASAGVMQDDGNFIAPSQPGVVTITATSLEDSRRSAQTTVVVRRAVGGLEVIPAQVRLTVNAVQGFEARIAGTDAAEVRWETSGGTITVDGRYTAPTAPGVYTVTAISLDDPTQRAASSVTVTDPSIALEVSPSNVILEAGSTLSFTANVSGTSDTRVIWEVSAGTITANGVFTAPSTPGIVTVTASSLIDPTRTASTTATITSAASLQGLLFHDVDADGSRDNLEPALAGWRVYLDLNDNGTLETNEPNAFTDRTGVYTLPSVPSGTFTLRHDLKPGYASSHVATQRTLLRPQVVGGTPATAGEQPFMVALLDSRINDPFAAHYCGASLIAPRWILTAAHCVFERGAVLPPSAVQAALGVTRLEGALSRSGIRRIVVHPQYNPSTDDNDIALLELETASSLQPVALLEPDQTALAAPGSNATVMGWGALSAGGAYPRDLQRATVPITTTEDCQAAFGSRVTASMICAGMPLGGVDTCQGDSGGPLLVNTPSGAPLFAGATSWEKGVRNPANPACTLEPHPLRHGSRRSWDAELRPHTPSR